MATVGEITVYFGSEVRRGIEAFCHERLSRVIDLCLVSLSVDRPGIRVGFLAELEPGDPDCVALCLERDGGYRGPGG